MGFLRNFVGIIVGIYGIWLIVTTFMAFGFNFRHETVNMYMFEVNIIGTFTKDVMIMMLGRLGMGAALLIIGKVMYQSDK